MHISDFYSFRSDFNATAIQAHITTSGEDDETKLSRAEYENFTFPVKFKQEYGKKFYDILGTGTVELFLISNKMKQIFEENHFIGWDAFPVLILDKKEKVINDSYYGLSVTGKCGPVDDSKAEIIEKQLIPNGTLSKWRKGKYIGLDKWDGSDFFIPENRLGIIVSTRVADVIKKNKLTNVALKNLADIESMILDD